MLLLNVAFALCGMAAVFFLVLGVARITASSKRNEQFRATLASITASEIHADVGEKRLPSEKSWTGYWLRGALDSGWKPETWETPGRAALAILILGGLGGFLVGDALAAIGVGVGGLFVFKVWLGSKASTRRKLMESQLPALISGMRANLQAQLTPQQAILSQVDEIAAPLGDELKILRQEVDVNIPLERALSNLSARVPSRSIRFLVSSIQMAIKEGVDLDPQLKIIQAIIVQRTKMANHLAAAVASAQPALWISGFAIPGGFLFMYYSSPDTQSFWMSPMGLLMVLVVAILYIVGMLVSRMMVKNVENA